MEEKFDSNVVKLEREIFDISKNINKFKNKNHKTLLNMLEKIRSFSNELKTKNDISIFNKKTSYENKRKPLLKAYQSLSDPNICPNNQTNKINQLENTKNPIIFKGKEIINDIANETKTIILYSNKKLHNHIIKKNYLTNMSYNLENKINNNFDIYDNINKKIGRNSCESHINKCFSFNFDESKKNELENDNDIKKRNNSLNNIKLNNIFKNDLSNDCPKNDLNYNKKNKIEFPKIKNENQNKSKNKKHIKKVKSYNQKAITKKIIKNIHFLTHNKNSNIKEIKNIKREHCNINISEYYKNINNKENNSKKKNSKIKIINQKKLRKYPSSANNNISNKNIINGINHSNSSRNYVYHKIYNNTFDNNPNNINNTVNGKEYTNYICSTFNHRNKRVENINDNERSYGGGVYTCIRKNMNSFREKIPINKNFHLISDNNNNNIINLKQNKIINKIERDSESNYNYSTNRRKSNNTDLNEDIIINKHKIINSNKYNKDFIDIITNKNNDNYKYDFESIYNNNINQKKENNSIQNNNIKYINIEEEKYNKLLLMLKCSNIDEGLNKIDILLNYEIFIKSLNSLFNKNNNFYSYKENNLRDIFCWIDLNIEQNKKYKDELKKYQNFCGKLLDEFSWDGFDKFKNDILKTVNKSKNNQNYFCGINDSNWNNENSNQINHYKESMNANSLFYNSNDSNSFKNKTNSYSNISFTNKKNGDEITLANIKN